MTCPRCGHDAAHAFYLDGWMIDPVRAVIAFKGPTFPIKHKWARLLVMVAAENGLPVSHNDIAAALNWKAGQPTRVQISQLRAFLLDLGMPCPIATVRGRGLSWSPPQALGSHLGLGPAKRLKLNAGPDGFPPFHASTYNLEGQQNNG